MRELTKQSKTYTEKQQVYQGSGEDFYGNRNRAEVSEYPTNERMGRFTAVQKINTIFNVMPLYCKIATFRYNFAVNAPMKTTRPENEAKDLFSEETSRRTFLKTTVASSALRMNGMRALTQLAGNEATATVAAETVRMIPNFLSSLTIARMKQLFGENAEKCIGQPIETAMTDLRQEIAEKRFPSWIVNWAIQQNDLKFMMELFQTMPFSARKDDGYDEGMRHIQKPESAFDMLIKENCKLKKASKKILEKIGLESETLTMVHARLGECIAIEIHERAMPSLQRAIRQIIGRKNLRLMQENKGSVSYNAYDGPRLLAKSLLQNAELSDQNNFEAIARTVTSDAHLKECVRQFTEDTPVRKHFLESVNDYFDSVAARMTVRKTVTRNDMTIEEKPTPAKNASSTERETAKGPVGDIAASIQHPFRRILAQIQLLADPSYQRAWGTSSVTKSDHE